MKTGCGYRFTPREIQADDRFNQLAKKYIVLAGSLSEGPPVMVDVGSGEGDQLLQYCSGAGKVYACEGNEENYKEAIKKYSKKFKEMSIDFRLADGKDMKTDLQGNPFIPGQQVAHIVTSRYGPSIEKEAYRTLVPGGYYIKSGSINPDALEVLIEHCSSSPEDEKKFQQPLEHARIRLMEKNGILGLPLYEERMDKYFNIIECEGGTRPFDFKGATEDLAREWFYEVLKMEWLWGSSFNPDTDRELFEKLLENFSTHEKPGEFIYRGRGNYIICVAQKN